MDRGTRFDRRGFSRSGQGVASTCRRARIEAEGPLRVKRGCRQMLLVGRTGRGASEGIESSGDYDEDRKV